MFKKFGLYFHIFLFLCFLWSNPLHAFSETKSPNIDAASYIVMDFETGVVLSEFQSDLPKPPASMTKMMTQFVVLDEIKKGNIKWEEKVPVSPRAEAIDEAQIQLVAGDQISIKELFIAMAVQSANDATVALVEYVAGSEEKFVQMMNQKAKELGMNQTHFWNSTGLNKESYPDPPSGDERHVMSARDTAILAQKLLKSHPEIIQYTSLSKYTFFEGTPRAHLYYNWNWMLPGLTQFYQGVDGFKTGHTNAAGYCFTGTAKRGNFRLITVVMGTKSQVARFAETKKLLDYGFDHFEVKTLIPSHQAIPQKEHLSLPNAVERSIPVVVSKPIRMPINKEEQDQYTYQVTYKKNLQAPIKKGTVIGEVRVLYRGEAIKGIDSVPLISNTNMEKGSWLRLQLRQWGDKLNHIFE